jgi:NAD(P)-dependent dehydrogenase (short-subunit alcohol dehydrogenase family)
LQIEGRVVVVTGAGRGIGRGVAAYLGANGASLAIGEYVPRRLDRILEELSALGVPALGVPCDVRRRSDIEELVKRTVDRFGKVDALVNNAMTFPVPGRLADLSEEDLDLAYTSGVKGTVWAMQAVYPHMRAARWGRIVNVASAAGLLGFQGYGAYGAAKEAVRAITRVAAREWAADGIVANCYCPASFTPREGGPDNPYVRDSYDRFWLQHPMGRVGEADADIGPVVLFLCSEGCRYMTGETLMVDGGTYMRA